METCCILRLRGLPYDSTSDDIKNFFDGHHVQDVHFLTRSGKPTGEAYVEFKDAETAAEAMKKRQKEHLGSRYIEIFDAPEASLIARAVDPSVEHPSPSLGGHVIRVRGLPFNAMSEEVLSFFNPQIPIGGPLGVLFICTVDGRPTGEAFMEFAEQEDVEMTLKKNKEVLGSRYIEVFASSKGDLYQIVHHRGVFTAVDGLRVHHPPSSLRHANSDPSNTSFTNSARNFSYRNPNISSRPRASSSASDRFRSDEVAQSFGSINISHRSESRQVTSYMTQRNFVVGVPPHGSSWMHVSAPAQRHFNPAPGPPVPAVGGAAPGSPSFRHPAVVMTPFLMQNPFMAAQSVAAASWAPGFVHNPNAQQQTQQPHAQQQQQQQQQQGAAWYTPAPSASRSTMVHIPTPRDPYTAPSGYTRAPRSYTYQAPGSPTHQTMHSLSTAQPSHQVQGYYYRGFTRGGSMYPRGGGAHGRGRSSSPSYQHRHGHNSTTTHAVPSITDTMAKSREEEKKKAVKDDDGDHDDNQEGESSSK